jgi:hypothetical protein
MRFAWLIFFAAVGVAYAQQPIAIENLFPDQIPRGQATAINVAIQSREMFQGAEVAPAAGVTVMRVENAKPAEDSQGVAWWRVTIQVAPDAAPGPRALSLLTAAGRTAPATVTIPTHVPTIANLNAQPRPQTIDVQFTMTDASADIGDKPYVWYTVDCGKDPIVGVVRGTVATGTVRASLPATKSGSCALQLRASDKNGIDSNTLNTRIN